MRTLHLRILSAAFAPRSGRLSALSARAASSTGFDVPQVRLNDGTLHPQLGFGTYKVGFIPASASAAAAGKEETGATGPTARECVAEALGLGYRFLDCAEFYGNEAEVGASIKDSGIARSELYLASKVWTTTIFQGEAAVRAQVLKTIQDLDCDFLDLYCVHWPVPGKHVDAYVALQGLHKEGLIKSLGLSNYAVEDYEELMADPRVIVPPSINQIEVNPFLYRRNTLAFFEKNGVVVQSYRALRDGKAFDDPTVVAIAAKHSKSPAQVLGRWCVQRGCIYIPKSVKKGRMAENAAVFDFELDADDLAKLDDLTTEQNLEAFEALYYKCVNRDTPNDGTMLGVKAAVTRD
mmetsp:Transcript_45758/g.103320  ORF Transcript_45758/g.103320 Transcript_45758/m.103320 type:complete len:350 (+) Transcript_45758:71-1120(+)